MSDDLSGFSLMELFRIEAESQAAILSSGLLALEAGASSPETLEPLMRAAHSVKGAARIVGVDAAVRVAHALEDDFVAAQKGTITLGQAHVDVLLRAVDLLTQIAQVPDDQIAPWQAAHEQVVAAMVADLKALLSAPPPQPPDRDRSTLPPQQGGSEEETTVPPESQEAEGGEIVSQPEHHLHLHRRPPPRRPRRPSGWCA